jgi:hypothetical protein
MKKHAAAMGLILLLLDFEDEIFTIYAIRVPPGRLAE